MDAWAVWSFATVSLVVPLLILLIRPHVLALRAPLPPPLHFPLSHPSPVAILRPCPLPSPSSLLPPPRSTFAFSSPADENFFISRLLDEARTSLSADRPMHALSLVLAAVRQQRGEEGVFDALNAAQGGLRPPAPCQPRQAGEGGAAREKEMKEDADVDEAHVGHVPAACCGPPTLCRHVGTGRAADTGGRRRGCHGRRKRGGGRTSEEDANESVLEERGEGATCWMRRCGTASSSPPAAGAGESSHALSHAAAQGRVVRGHVTTLSRGDDIP